MTQIDRRGQALLEFMVALPVSILACTWIAFAFLVFVAQAWLDVDSYMLARAHLYGNDLGHCAPSRAWPHLGKELRVEFACSGKSSVEARVLLNERILASSDVNLGEP